MAENFELLEIGQIEIMHGQVHARLESDGSECFELRNQHDSLAAELVKHGLPHDTEIICPESELAQRAPNYRRGFTDEICTQCAFGQLFPFCNLYKADYARGDTCDSFRDFDILELEPPHGFLIANGKQKAIASISTVLYIMSRPDGKFNKAFVIVSGGEVFGIAELEEPVQMKTKEFDTDEWQSQHRVTSRERRQWWPDTEVFYIHRIKKWYPYEDIKLYEDGKVIDEPKLSAKQWKLVSKAKELPKQITLVEDAVSVTDKQEFVVNLTAKCKELDSVLSATYELDVKEAKEANELISIYSLALVRNPRMRVSKKNIAEAVKKEVIEANEKQEGETMPFRIRKRGDEYCVVKINADDSDGDISGCHETRDEAEDQLTALNINVTAEEGESSAHEDKPKKRKPKKRKEAESSQTAEKATFAGLDQAIQTGFAEKPKKAGIMPFLRMMREGITDFLKAAEIGEKEGSLFVSDVGIAQKTVNGKLWHLTWSANAFKDREGEIFSIKSLQDYVNNNEDNEDKGFFNLYHINEEDGNFNTDFARKEWQGIPGEFGRFLVEAGPYLEDHKGQSAKKFFSEFADGHPEVAPEGWGCSPEYKYLPEERVTGVYENIWITRTSTLPRMAAANIWTETRQLNRGDKMALNEKQITPKQLENAIALFGQEFVDNMSADADKRTKDLETAGIANKSNETEVEVKEVSFSDEQFQTLAQEVAKQFQLDNTAMLEALSTMASGIKEIGERVEELENKSTAKGLAETPSFTFSLQRASEQEETIVAGDDKLRDEKPVETQKVKSQAEISPADFFGTN